MLRRFGVRRTGPLLSVVVPVYNVEQYLDACLRSIREQHYRSIEIVIVDDGSPDDSMVIARRHAAEDDRIRLVERPNGGLSAARNTGVEAARGEFLTFVDSDDLVTADGWARAMQSLRRTQSDIAVLRYGRLRDGKSTGGAAWIRKLHAEPHIAVTLEQRPDVLLNATAWAKVFRRDFYDSAGLRFVEGIIYEDQAFTAAAYAAARSIDVLPVTGYEWRVNDASMSQGQVTLDNLLGRLNAADDSLVALEGHPARGERALQLLKFNLPNSLLKLERADDVYLGALIERASAIVDAAPADRFAREVPAEFRVLYALLANGDPDAIWRYVRAEGMEAEMHPSGQEPAGFTTYLPGWQSDPVPAEAYVLTAEQTALNVNVRQSRTDGADLVLDVAAWFPNVELTAPTLTVNRPAQVEHSGRPAVFNSRQGSERPYPGSGWTITLPGGARRRPDQIAITLTSGERSQTKTVRVPAPVA